MTATMWIGALLALCGVVLLALGAIDRGKLSDSHADPVAGPTLEPFRRGLGFFGSGRNWPGLFLLGIGAITLLTAALLYPG